MAKKPSPPIIEKTEEELALELKKKKKKSRRMKIGAGIFVFLFIFIGMQPRMGSIQYGICKVFVELNEPYPSEIKILAVEDYTQVVRIYYSSIGISGEQKSNSIDCAFNVDEAGNVSPELKAVNINGKKPYEAEKPEYIKRFNMGVQAIVDNPPDLALPDYDLGNIAGYRDMVFKSVE